MTEVTHWSVRVAAATTEPATAEHAETMLEALAGYEPVVSASADPQSIEATVDVQAVNLRAALTTGMKAVGDALRSTDLHGTIDLVEAKSYEHVDRELARPPVPDLVGAAEIVAMVEDPPISRQRAHQLMERDDFPPPVAELAAGKVFVRSQVEAFLRNWPRKRTGRPRGTGAKVKVSDPVKENAGRVTRRRQVSA